MEGGTVCGHAGVRQYWTRQWTMINPRVGPLQFRLEETNRTVRLFIKSFRMQIRKSDHPDV
jgi:hypothetical protein